MLIQTQQDKFYWKSKQNGNTTAFFIIKEAKETVLDFSKETVRAM